MEIDVRIGKRYSEIMSMSTVTPSNMSISVERSPHLGEDSEVGHLGHLGEDSGVWELRSEGGSVRNIFVAK